MRHWCLFVLLIQAPLLARAQTPGPTPNCDYVTYQALQSSGVYRELEHVAELASSDTFMQETSQGRKPDPRFASIFRPIVLKDFDADVMKRDLRRRLVVHCHPQITQVLQALQAPLIVRMVQLEGNATDPKSREEMKSYIATVGKNPPADRLKAIQAFDKATGASDFSIRTTVAAARGMSDGVGAPPSVLAQVETRVNADRAQLERATQLNLLYVYRNVTSADLESYTKLITAEPLKSFYSQVKEALLDMFEMRSRLIGQELRSAYIYSVTAPAKAR